MPSDSFSHHRHRVLWPHHANQMLSDTILLQTNCCYHAFKSIVALAQLTKYLSWVAAASVVALIKDGTCYHVSHFICTKVTLDGNPFTKVIQSSRYLDVHTCLKPFSLSYTGQKFDQNISKIRLFFEDPYVLTFIRRICKGLKIGLETTKVKKQLGTEL